MNWIFIAVVIVVWLYLLNVLNRAKLELGIDSTEMPESVRKVISEYEKKLRDNMPKE